MSEIASRCNPFVFDKDSRETPFTLQTKWIDGIFQNRVFFEVLVSVLTGETKRAWRARCLKDVRLLNRTGRLITPQEMAQHVYFAASEEILNRYSSMLGFSMNQIAQLATMAYEKDDFKPGTQMGFDILPWAWPGLELGEESRGTAFCAENLRTIRKLLSGVKRDENFLYFRGRKSEDGTYRYFCEGYAQKSVSAAFRFTFYGGERWGFQVGNASEDLFTVKNRQLLCPAASFRFSLFRLEEEFRNCRCASGFTSGGLRDFLEALRTQGHGSSVVFAPFHACPAVRERFEALEKAERGRSVNRFDGGDPDFYEAVTELARIDGAFGVDLGIESYRLAYFAMILDGRVRPSGKGWASSGARANSVLTFVRDILWEELERISREELKNGPPVKSREELCERLRSKKIPIAAIIFSEDGYVTPVLGSDLIAELIGEVASEIMDGLQIPSSSHTP